MSRYGSTSEDEFLDKEIEIVQCIRKLKNNKTGEVMD